MDNGARSRVWNCRAALYDVCEGSQLRRAPAKQALFHHMHGRVLFAAVGTGIDIACFPPGKEIVGIDISDEMLRRAEPRRQRYQGNMHLVRADAGSLSFSDRSFDCAVTSCTLCSVPSPLRTLREIYRVLKPGAPLLMFEHVRSQIPLFGWTLDLMTLWTRPFGTEMNRDTLSNAMAAGFQIEAVESVFLDVILAVRAVKPSLARERLQVRQRKAQRTSI